MMLTRNTINLGIRSDPKNGMSRWRSPQQHFWQSPHGPLRIVPIMANNASYFLTFFKYYQYQYHTSTSDAWCFIDFFFHAEAFHFLTATFDGGFLLFGLTQRLIDIDIDIEIEIEIHKVILATPHFYLGKAKSKNGHRHFFVDLNKILGISYLYFEVLRIVLVPVVLY
jgi:hypothetical protein